jgi:hypothetical protein
LGNPAFGKIKDFPSIGVATGVVDCEMGIVGDVLNCPDVVNGAMSRYSGKVTRQGFFTARPKNAER